MEKEVSHTLFQTSFLELTSQKVRSQWLKELEKLEKYVQHWKAFESSPHLLSSSRERKCLEELGGKLREYLEKGEEALRRSTFPTKLQEELQAILIRLKDLSWAVEREILENVRAVEELLGEEKKKEKLFSEFFKLQILWNSLNRLEVRGRDSAGISVFLHFPSREFLEELVKNLPYPEEWEKRCRLSYPTDGAIFYNPFRNGVWFFFKIAKEVGKLGENVEYLKKRMAKDSLFRHFLSQHEVQTSYLAHTRWASHGVIHLYNCHPVDNRVLWQGKLSLPPLTNHPLYGSSPAYVVAALNGDIDNFLELRELLEKKGYIFPSGVSTDAKIIPLWIYHHLEKGMSFEEAFLEAVRSFEGSAAIAVQTDLEPGKVFLSLKGSGQAIYVGLGEDSYLFSSEIYGFVEQTPWYLKLDGEVSPSETSETVGQVFVLSREVPFEGIRAYFHEGTEIPVTQEKVKRAEITTRDIDRRGFDHYFLKEISEAPDSVRKTLAGKFLLENGVEFLLGEEILPCSIRQALLKREIQRIYVIGQGTAGVAAMAIGAFLHRHLSPLGFEVLGMSASEMSGFYLRPQMSDTLVIAVTQSGTTTDTNHAVELAKKRGAKSLAIVNRRNSDITYKVDGIFYTSDGRDVEMSVASTKAFYSQVAAGAVLSFALAKDLKSLKEESIREALYELWKLPEKMEVLLEKKEIFQKAASATAPFRKHWAVVGSGWNYIAAREIRIKLSELCYKSIACDYVEDKKHIDLSSEPLIVVCAAGHEKRVLLDIVKDTAIFKAHKSLPIVFADSALDLFQEYSDWVIPIPSASSMGALVLNTLAGHLFGYYAALSIHEEGVFLLKIRMTVVELLDKLSKNSLEEKDLEKLEKLKQQFFERLFSGRLDGSLPPRLAAKVGRLLEYSTGKLPLQSYAEEFHRPPLLHSVWESLIEALTEASQELIRSIDAIKHQAKTVTVGTSRLELPKGVLFAPLKELGFSLENLDVKNMAYLKRVQPAIQKVLGYTLYEVGPLGGEGEVLEETRIWVVKKQGLSQNLTSRAETPSPLKGGKRFVLLTKEARVDIGRRDGRPILLLPLMDAKRGSWYILLYHLAFVEDLPRRDKVALLSSKKREEIQTLVTESDIGWDESYWDFFTPKELLLLSSKEIEGKILKKLSQR